MRKEMNINYDVWCYLVDDILKRIDIKKYDSVYGVPRGGTLIAERISNLTKLEHVQDIRRNTLIVDDLIDSGKTKKKYAIFKSDFEVLIDKQTDDNYKDVWINFWYEEQDKDDEDLVVRIAQRMNVKVIINEK